jgi:error-prone DNA polymerase
MPDDDEQSGRFSAYPPYAELDVTTNFSFLRGASHPDELVATAAALGHAAVGVTDVNSVAGVVRAHEATKRLGIPLCVGARLRFAEEHTPDVLVWVASRAGWANLCRLLTTGKMRAEKGQCTLHLDNLLAQSGGLVAAVDFRGIEPSAGGGAAHLDPWPLTGIVRRLKEAFSDDRLSLAMARLHTPDDEAIVRLATTVGQTCGVPLLVNNGVHYHAEGRRMLQDIVTCIRHGCTIHDAGFHLFPNGERFLKTPADMYRLFPDLPAAVRRSGHVARQCAGFSLDQLKYEYPAEVVPPGETPVSYLAKLAWAGAAERYPQGIPEKVRGQIEDELKLIRQMDYEQYFLTVHDVVRFARSKDILCQGRGSAANSVVCYCLGVTSADPEVIPLLIDRFISTNRHEPPDIDIDFEHERREEVIQYIYEKYGRHRAGMTAEVIRYRGRSAVREVGKALGLGLDAIDAIARRFDGWHSGSLSREQLAEVGLDPDDRTVAQLVWLSSQLLGFPRHLSQHVGGMVMTRGPLCELVPIENASMDGRTVIEWDKDDIDVLKILKVDLLALGMLTAIAKALQSVNAARHDEPPLTLATIPQEDPEVYGMISNADTIGVFQIESRAQMSMLPRLRPRTYYDLVIEVAIVRPGPIQGNMVHPYLRRRNGEEPVSYPTPELEEVLGRTLGVPLFQEQAMKIVMTAASFSGAEANQFRRSMAAWRYNGTIERFRDKVIDGMLLNGYTRDFAERCFDQIKGFGEYGFPESHAASFALLVYASAWLKRHHPAAFTCALLNSQPMGFYRPAQLVRDAQEHGVTVRPVDVNASEWDCTLEDAEDRESKIEDRKGRDSSTCDPRSSTLDPRSSDATTWGRNGPALRLGMRMVSGFRRDHADRIVAARGVAGGAFASVDHFHEVTGLPVSAVTRLSEADAFASLANRRAALWDAMALPDERPPLRTQRPLVNATTPVDYLPGMALHDEVSADYETTGLSLKAHPVGLVRDHLAKRQITPAVDLWTRRDESWVRVAGLVLLRQRPGTAKNIVFMTIEDETGIVNLIVRPQVYDRFRPAARGARLLQADGYVQRQGQVTHVTVVAMHDLGDLLPASYDVRSRDFR